MKIIRQLIDGDNPIIGFLPDHDKKDLLGILFLISNMNSRFFTHSLNDNWMNISRDMKYSLFGQYRYRTLIYGNSKHIFNQLFTEMYTGNSIHGLMSGYEPTSLLKDIYQKWICLNENTPFDIKKINDKNIKISQDEVYKEDEEQEFDFCEDIKVNPIPIEKNIRRILKNNPSLKELKIVVQLKEILGKLSLDNKLKLYYREVMSGRYYSLGKHHIQGLKKEIRDIVLSGYHEYDLNTSSPILLCQIYRGISGLRPPESIITYIDEKVGFRSMLGIKYRLSDKDSKTFFTSLFFNSKLIPYDFEHKTKLSKVIDPLIINKILEDDLITQLRKDIQMVYSTIYKHYRKNIVDGCIEGYKNKKYTPEDNKFKSTKIVSHVYQSLESYILDKMIEFYKQQTKDTNYVRIHDCLYTKKSIDELEMEEFVRNESGFIIMIKERPSDTILGEFVRMFDMYDETYEKWGHLFHVIIGLPSNNTYKGNLERVS